MVTFKILNMVITAPTVIKNLNQIIKDIQEYSISERSYVVTANFDNTRDLTFCYNIDTKNFGIFFVTTNRLSTKAILSEREMPLLELSFKRLILMLKERRLNYTLSSELISAWLEYLKTDKPKEATLRDYYASTGQSFDKQYRVDADLVTDNICISHGIDPNDKVERAYLALSILGKLT